MLSVPLCLAPENLFWITHEKTFYFKGRKFWESHTKILSTFKQKVAGIKCHKNLKIKS